jgi:hypothetical protein
MATPGQGQHIREVTQRQRYPDYLSQQRRRRR